jgi:hypothetical protein
VPNQVEGNNGGLRRSHPSISQAGCSDEVKLKVKGLTPSGKPFGNAFAQLQGFESLVT